MTMRGSPTGITVNIDEDQRIQVTDQTIEAEPPSRLVFAAEGVLSVTETLLGEFEGAALTPVRIGVSVAGSRTIEIDLTEEPSLRLETIDVGVATPDAADLPSGIVADDAPDVDTLRSTMADGPGSSDATPGAIAFTVEGAISGLSDGTIDPLIEATPTVTSITFAVDESSRTDGGSGSDIVFEFDLQGFSVTIRRDGTIEIVGEAATDVGLL